jgi:hypothetical protein
MLNHNENRKWVPIGKGYTNWPLEMPRRATKFSMRLLPLNSPKLFLGKLLGLGTHRQRYPIYRKAHRGNTTTLATW